MAVRRIAIVGFGPRGLGALERLIAHHRPSPASGLELSIYEPHRDLGAGPAYDHAQPPFLLMNFPAARIDLAWPAEQAPRSAFEGGSFVDWVGADRGRAERWYPPRALVGRYLSAAADAVIRSAPFPVELLREQVLEIERMEAGWRLRAASGSRQFDEVLLAVGHAPPRSPYGAGPDQVEPGARVGVRGFGLTAIDRILELTEGRGGRFEPAPGGSLRYVAAGAEPAAILPHSRGGRPMLVKPEIDRARPPAGQLLAAIERERDGVRRLPPGSGVERLGAAIASSCADLLGHAGVRAAAATWLAAAITGRLEPAPDPAGAISRSLRIDRAEADPDLSWGLGVAWRELYPAIVERFSHGGLPAGDRLAFRRLGAELERLAFGPPPVNGAKLSALIEAGVLDLSELSGPRSGTVDTEIDAVIEPPGLREHQAPMAGLVANGSVRVPPGVRGIEVTGAAHCVGADGSVTEGLAACGRLTEDWVIGNDTLNRGLHPEIDRWAATVCAATHEPALVGA